jgi:hypothetical protein
MTDALYEKLVHHWEQVTDLPTQRVGPFTPLYKGITKRLKIMPWPLLLVISLAFVFVIYIVLGSAITFLVSILQRGF